MDDKEDKVVKVLDGVVKAFKEELKGNPLTLIKDFLVSLVIYLVITFLIIYTLSRIVICTDGDYQYRPEAFKLVKSETIKSCSYGFNNLFNKEPYRIDKLESQQTTYAEVGGNIVGESG